MTEKNENQRKASDVLSELEHKIDLLMNTIQTQNFNIKILSNKLNLLIDLINMKSLKSDIITATPETTFSNKNIIVDPESMISMETNPKGFRRNSRPETFENSQNTAVKTSSKAEIVIPISAKPTKEPAKELIKETAKIADTPKQTVSVPVIQRVTDKLGKSIFLAEVEVTNLEDKTLVKSRTNGAGKWMAALPIGNYEIKIRKFDQDTKNKLEIIQNLSVDGSISPLELNPITFK